MTETFVLKSEADTENLAAKIAPLLKKGDVLALFGDLGAGKTFFTQKLCTFLQVLDDVNSPSFVIMNEYCGILPIFHFDLYRLSAEEELWELGIADILEEGITIIEWPELARQLLPKHTYHFYFEIEGNSRIVKVEKK
jgi:tRNA threonylcarbamoyladenosine biosynthesis protein TsaE